jgi:uncharacterized protein DUF3303
LAATVRRRRAPKEVEMLFVALWENRPGTEASDKRILNLFTNWRPPAGVEFKGFYDYADSSGGVAIVEASSAEAILETTAPWGAFLRFTVRPIVPSDKSSAIYAKAIAWRDSIR